MYSRCLPVVLACVVLVPVLALVHVPRAAADAVIEEIVVTARQMEETLQDVPVTVAAFSEADLDRYHITTLTEASKMIPNFQINQGGSGNGSNLYLRGVGSSSISAAFDQSVAINIDGVVVNIGRFIHNAYMDMAQLEVLKGPQSLYFGKSATAGVVSLTTKDPGDEFELEFMAGLESEHDRTYGEVVVSGPVTERLGARLALGLSQADELYENLHPGASKRWRGEDAVNARLTLVWDPLDTLRLRFKHHHSTYENDGPTSNTEEFCPEGVVQPTTALQNAVIFPGVDDCRLNGNTSASDLQAPLIAGNPLANGGVPYLEQDTRMTSLQADWDVTPTLALTSVSAWVELDHDDFDLYDYNAGIFGGGHANLYDAFSQELRLASAWDTPLNFQAGLYYQDVEQGFEAYQYAVNIGLVAPDPVTGNGYDYNKNQFLEAQVYSAFVAAYWQLTDRLEVTAGVRYTEEEKDGYITIPYVHAFLAGAFGAPPFIGGLEFEDENTSPEIAFNYYVNDDVSVFLAYKEGFKSGGIDNSALPSASLDPSTNPDFPGFLIYESEEADGFEVGLKARLREGSLRVNATAFDYTYSDLQTQLFDSEAIQFTTLNASELETRGIEADLLWLTPVEGLALRGAIALTHAEYTDTFVNTDEQDLNGEDRERSADLAATAGLSYDMALGERWRLGFSYDARYSSDYRLLAVLNPYEQDSFWLHDAALRLISADERYELALIGRNLGDEIYAYSSGNRPGACVNADPTNPNLADRCAADVLNVQQDQIVTTSLGREIRLQFRMHL